MTEDNTEPSVGGAGASPPELTYHEIPSRGLYRVESKAAHQRRMNEAEARTRDILAYGIVGVLASFNLLLIIGLFIGVINVDELIRTVGALSGIQTLGAAVAGFYFARSKKN